MSNGEEQKESQPLECFSCKNNGFPMEMIILTGKNPTTGVSIKKNPDHTPHTHKTKLAPRQYSQYQAPITKTPPLTGSGQQNSFKTKDEEIARMHEENMEVKKAERDLMRQDIDAKLQIAIALKALADAIKERGSTGIE